MKWYVYFTSTSRNVRSCHCFEQHEEQARHFAKLVNGELYCGDKPVITEGKIASAPRQVKRASRI